MENQTWSDESHVINMSDCVNPMDEVDWSNPGLVLSLVILGVINVVVLLGNCLVVLAVFLDSRLRTVTNLFIVSLAMADLSVGVAVLPFSASLEVLNLWIFGEIWCSIWLAVDVWMCTASILNLCAISLDRYLAVTRPVSYPSIMSPTRAKILLAVVWTLSFVICFPPLVGWNDRKVNKTQSAITGQDYCDNWTCELTNDAGYVVYSALGSFFIPMLVMLFFYWRIYRAAVETTKAINQGFRTTKEGGRGNGGPGVGGMDSKGQQEKLTLRIHRGRGQKLPKTTLLMAKHGVHPPGFGFAMAGIGTREMARMVNPTEANKDANNTTLGVNNTTGGGGATTNGPAGDDNGADRQRNGLKSPAGQTHLTVPPRSNFAQTRSCSIRSDRSDMSNFSTSSSTYTRENVSNASQAYKVLYMETPLCGCSPRFGRRKCRGCSKNKAPKTAMEIFGPRESRKPRSKSRENGKDNNKRRKCKNTNQDHGQPNMAALESGIVEDPLITSTSPTSPSAGHSKPVHKLNRRNIKAQVKRFKMETKAAKTLGIIVGGFIVCWMPFFTMYVVRAFCPQCIPSVLFSILFWLGYCNSAINPCIYALFSRDFRFAFQKILCKCLCTKKSHVRHGHQSNSHVVPPQVICFSEDSEYANDHSESN